MRRRRSRAAGGPALARAFARAPGTCGELAQGMLDGALVMVTCPIDRFSKATVVHPPRDRPRSRAPVPSGWRWCCPSSPSRARTSVPPPEPGRQPPPLATSDFPKSTQAAGLTLEYLGRTDIDVLLAVGSPIPREKGMAGSTADVLASIAATAAALGADLSVRRQADLALAVEPSDGTMFPGIALFDHRHGRIGRTLGYPPPMRVLVLEFGERVDTETFNAVDRRAALQSQSECFEEALDTIALGLRSGESRLIGQGATINAIAYQNVFPNRHLAAVMSLGRKTGAVGVNVAHSGSVVGLLFGEGQSQFTRAADQARLHLPGLTAVHGHRLIGGGVRSIRANRGDIPSRSLVSG